jgi:sRNA-binding carbon storage regulator CsrA
MPIEGGWLRGNAAAFHVPPRRPSKRGRSPHVGNLILKRRRGESVFIEHPDGRMLSVTLVEIRGDSARLSFVATKDFKILRGEILQREEAKHRPPGATGSASAFAESAGATGSASALPERSRAAAIVPLDSLRLSVSAVALTPASVGSPT